MMNRTTGLFLVALAATTNAVLAQVGPAGTALADQGRFAPYVEPTVDGVTDRIDPKAGDDGARGGVAGNGCGDDVADPDESCDGADAGDVGCAAEGTGSANACRADCSCCGDGIVDTGEECDDGIFNSDTFPGACRTTCVRASCGDNVADFPGETCDGTDGGFDCSPASSGAADACRADCSCCGDGNLDAGEECDNLNSNSDTTPNACRTNCVNPSCGDNVADFPGESCDGTDGGFDCRFAACRADCSCCGDGNLDPGEECDNLINNSDTTPDACRTNCVRPSCGDNVADPINGETCDGTDGSFDCSAAGSGFADACRADCSCCGDGNLDAGEECDNLNNNSDTTPDACRTTCVRASCGDNVTDTGESCDGTGADFGLCSAAESGLANACRADCSCCGDGELDAGEACDNGALNSDTTPDACRTTCVLPSCGDNVTDTGEECDDANLDNTDCCTNTCEDAECGDGFLLAAICPGITPEECDDGNTSAGDTCSSTCQIEPRLSVSEKGSILYYSKIELKWSCAGSPLVCTPLQDTFLTIVNDYPREVFVQWYFINGDDPTAAVIAGSPPVVVERAHKGCNQVDCITELSANKTTYMSALTGAPLGCQPFRILDNGPPPGRPDPENPGQRILRGYAIAFAVDNNGNEISWNHLSGHVDIVNYAHRSAWEYNTYAFQCVFEILPDAPPAIPVPVGDQCGTDPGILHLNGIEYDFAFDRLLFDFYAVGSFAFSSFGPPITTVQLDTDLTLYPVSADLRTVATNSTGPVLTRAKFDIWNQNEDAQSGVNRCINCWDQALLSNYAESNSFLFGNLQTNKGKARIDGIKSDDCDPPGACCDLTSDPDCDLVDFERGTIDRDCSEDAALLGVSDKIMFFSGPGTPLGARTDAGTTLVGQGTEEATIWHEIIEPPDTLTTGLPDIDELDSADLEQDSDTQIQPTSRPSRRVVPNKN